MADVTFSINQGPAGKGPSGSTDRVCLEECPGVSFITPQGFAYLQPEFISIIAAKCQRGWGKHAKTQTNSTLCSYRSATPHASLHDYLPSKC